MRKAKVTTNFLGQIDPQECKELLRDARYRDLRKGEFVFRVAEQSAGVFFLISGRLKFFRLAPNGREVILWYCFPGEVFGMAGLDVTRGRRVNVQTCEASKVAILPEAAFNRYLDEHPATSRLCRSVMAARLGILTNVLVNLVVDDASTRIAKLILHLGERYGVRRGRKIYLQIPLTHQEIAGMIGVTRQTASAILSEFRNKGLLNIDNHRIHIERECKLTDLARHLPERSD